MFKRENPTDIETQAVMQHYGYRSFFVDVTSDLKVALWFSLHQFVSERAPFHVDKQLRSAIFQWAHYVPCPEGFIYCILVPETESSAQYVDLTKIMPVDAMRIYRQSAGAIFPSPKSRSIDSRVVAKLRIFDDGWFSSSNQNVGVCELFPRPNLDTFYRCLCTVPYYMTPEAEFNNMYVAHPLLGFFPIYAETAKELFKEYVPLTRVFSHAHPALVWNVATAVADLENRRFKTAGAIRILLSLLMIQNLTKDADVNNAVLTAPWPSNNLLLEFEPEASLITPSTKALTEAIRGLWIILGKKSLRIAEIIDTFDDVTIGHECVYSLPELNLAEKQGDSIDRSYNLRVVQNISYLLQQGSVFLSKDDHGYMKLNWRNED
jgi:hypothetical protein